MKRILQTILLSWLFLIQCSTEEATPSNSPTISSFTPTTGILETEVIITGTNFSTVTTENIVQFSGHSAKQTATVTAATSTELTVVVPALAITGKVTVSVNNQEAISSTDFVVPSPIINSFTPTIGGTGMSIFIDGANFSTTPENNAVSFHLPGMGEGTVTDATETQLTVTVPDNTWVIGGPGVAQPIIVRVGANTTTSSNSFLICNYAELIVSDLEYTSISSGTSCSYNFTIRNVGKSSLDLTKFTFQTYISQDATLGGGDQAAGGVVLDAGGTLTTGQTYSSAWSSNGDITTYPYLIIDIINDTLTVNECNTSNNRIAILIQM